MAKGASRTECRCGTREAGGEHRRVVAGAQRGAGPGTACPDQAPRMGNIRRSKAVSLQIVIEVAVVGQPRLGVEVQTHFDVPTFIAFANPASARRVLCARSFARSLRDRRSRA